MKVLVIGGVACGPKTASRLKRLCPDADITMIERDSIVSYGACGIPYYVEGFFKDINALVQTPVGAPRTPTFFDKVKGFKVITKTEAVKIDRQNKKVHVRSVETGDVDILDYDKLVLATGGSPVRPPISGIELENVTFMTHPDNAANLVENIEKQGLKNAVLVGAGLINIEMAEALTKRGVKVTVVEMAQQVMPGAFDADISMLAQRYMRHGRLNFVFGEKVTAIKGEKAVSGVETEKQVIPADVVVIATGTRPNDGLAKESGLACMEKGGILINEYCQTSDQDIYAGGDCTVNSYIDKITGSPVYVPLGSTANKHGRTIANHIAGVPVPFKGVSATAIVKAFNFTMSRTGLSEKQAKALNLDIETAVWAGMDMPHYMPRANPIIIKMIASKKDRKLLGLQAVGMGDAAKRLDVAATAILMGATVDDLSNIDFAYAPPYGPPIDPLAVCSHVLINKLEGVANSISANQAKVRIDNKEVVLVDVRSPGELDESQLPYDFISIPIEKLKERANELPKDKDILTFCMVGLRGYDAQKILNRAGFDRVQFVEGGIAAWPFEIAIPEIE